MRVKHLELYSTEWKKDALRYVTDTFLSCVPTLCSHPSLCGRQVFSDGTETPPACSILLLASQINLIPSAILPLPFGAVLNSFLRGFQGVCVRDEALHGCDYSCCFTLGVTDLKGD